ncbi:MAG: HlyD family efflux transporter periplasmic adaptor subunit, partial [Planctomycetota bacterium]
QLDPDVAVNERTPANGVLGLMTSYDTRLAQLQALRTKRELAEQKHDLDKAAAEAQVMGALASLAQAEAKVSEIRMQGKRLSYLGEAADIASEDYQRLEELAAADPELVTDRQLRRQANRVDQAQKDYEIASQSFASGLAAAESALEAAQANKQAAERSRDKLAAMNPVQAVDEEIRLAENALSQSILLTPDQDPSKLDVSQIKLRRESDLRPGPYTVLKVFLRPGEAVTQTPVLQIGDLSEIVCVAEVYEADAKNIREGQKAIITSNAFRKEFAEGITGRVDRISRIVASPGLDARNPLAPVDRSVVAVRIVIDPRNAEATAEASQWIGLQVQVEFEQ